MDLHGQALFDYWRGDHEAVYTLRRDDEVAYPPISVRDWFYPEGLPELDRIAVNSCQGRVLELGAGAGSHALAVQKLGLAVTAVDISALAVEVMRERGVHDARVGDLYDLHSERYDTILILRNIGITGTLAGLDRFLHHLPNLLNPEGQLITDSIDPREPTDADYQAYQRRQIAGGKYLGERTLRFEYKGLVSSWFDWLHIDPETLEEHVYQADLSLELIAAESRTFLCAIRQE
jgi:2-polyprenyl-3-methyl-5-hydroxy-6-metoxy-1,4-benzoquinol methylase